MIRVYPSEYESDHQLFDEIQGYTSAQVQHFIEQYRRERQSIEGRRIQQKKLPRFPSQCRYAHKFCLFRQARKKNGSNHSLCPYHRQKSVSNQRKADAKRKLEKSTCPSSPEPPSSPSSPEPDAASPRRQVVAETNEVASRPPVFQPAYILHSTDIDDPVDINYSL